MKIKKNPFGASEQLLILEYPSIKSSVAEHVWPHPTGDFSLRFIQSLISFYT